MHARCCYGSWEIAQRASHPMKLALVDKGLDRLNELYSSVSAFAADPAAKTKAMILDVLHEKMLMYLCCECCKEPQEGDGSVWPITIDSPKEVVFPLLPLAKVAVHFCRVVNVGLQVGKCFGLPTPSIDDKYLREAGSFLDKAGDATLQDFELLQELVSSHWPAKHSAADQMSAAKERAASDSEKRGGSSSVSASGSSFSISEFESFLSSAKGDPASSWKKVLQCVIDDDGNKLYVCKACEKQV